MTLQGQNIPGTLEPLEQSGLFRLAQVPKLAWRAENHGPGDVSGTQAAWRSVLMKRTLPGYGRPASLYLPFGSFGTIQRTVVKQKCS